MFVVLWYVLGKTENLLRTGVSICDGCGCAASLLQRLKWPLVEQGGALSALEVGGECESGLVKEG